MIRRLEETAPEVLKAQVTEAVFEVAVEGLIKELPDAYEKAHFYCSRCGRYHLKVTFITKLSKTTPNHS
jgi:hypothetical protein